MKGRELGFLRQSSGRCCKGNTSSWDRERLPVEKNHSTQLNVDCSTNSIRPMHVICNTQCIVMCEYREIICTIATFSFLRKNPTWRQAAKGKKNKKTHSHITSKTVPPVSQTTAKAARTPEQVSVRARGHVSPPPPAQNLSTPHITADIAERRPRNRALLSPDRLRACHQMEHVCVKMF